MIPNFEWDLAKARDNAAKHGVTFEEAATVFADDDARIEDDVEHSDALSSSECPRASGYF